MLLMLPLRLPSPTKAAVTVLEPCGSKVVLSLTATPSIRLFVLNATSLVRKTTTPAGMFVAGDTGATVSVNVTLVPGNEGFPDDTTEFVESYRFTVNTA